MNFTTNCIFFGSDDIHLVNSIIWIICKIKPSIPSCDTKLAFLNGCSSMDRSIDISYDDIGRRVYVETVYEAWLKTNGLTCKGVKSTS